ncbi:MAG: hypothetical protein F4Y57_11970 [Acidobacteria bacterium]|nr:hypothetical protein [Acidobacteriota bacterium]
MRAFMRGLDPDRVAEPDHPLPAFGHLLKAHIHKEERQLFEQMQAACAPAELEALGARVAAAHDAAEPACEV